MSNPSGWWALAASSRLPKKSPSPAGRNPPFRVESRTPNNPISHLMPFTVSQIAEQIHGEVIGDGAAMITGLAPADSAKQGDLTFAEKDTYFAAAEQSQATAILVSNGFASSKKALIRVPNARVAVARLLPVFFPPDQHAPGIHSSATVSPSAQI